MCDADHSGDSALLQFDDGSEVLITAHVTKEGVLEEENSGDVRQRLDLETEQVVIGNESHVVRAGLRTSVYTQQPGGSLTYKEAALLFAPSTMESACVFPPKSPRHVTSATPVLLTTGLISGKTVSQLWLQRNHRALKFSQDSPATGLSRSDRASTAASSRKSTCSGRNTKPRSWTPQFRNCYPRCILSLRSFQWERGIPTDILDERFSRDWQKLSSDLPGRSRRCGYVFFGWYDRQAWSA